MKGLQRHSLEKLAQEQEVELERRRKELLRAETRIRELEDALKSSCDYSEVCKHFPGIETLHRVEH